MCYFYILLILTSALIQVSNGHPQCLDTYPPFKAKSPTTLFCSHYKKFGCCTVEQHAEMEERYDNIVDELKKKGLPLCEKFIKEILCQWCSPYAAHVFEVQIHFPDLCPDYCSQLYRECKHVVPYITKETEITDALGSEEEFCGTVGFEDVLTYCWPDIISNTDLNRVIVRQTESTVGCLCLKEFASGLYNPMRMITSNDGTGRLFVLEQRGFVWIFSKSTGQKKSKPFLNWSHRIRIRTNRGNENGLIGLAFHPDYKNNRKLYVHYTRNGPINFDGVSVIAEFRASETDPDMVDTDTFRVIMEVNQPTSIHNAGELLFGIDGYLYIFHGDGGPGYDTINNGQDTTTLLGSILRVDVDDPSVPYRVPKDNPYVKVAGFRPEIYAYGVRNPWAADVDEGDPDSGYGKGRIIFGDVGQARWEEVNMLVKGGNFGWRSREGAHCSQYPGIEQPKECNALGYGDNCAFDRRLRTDCGYPGINQKQCEDLKCCYDGGYVNVPWCFPPMKANTQNLTKYSHVIEPIGDFSHSFGNAVVPGRVYRGCNNPALNGLYIFGFHFSSVGGRMYYLNETREGSNVWTHQEVNLCGTDICYNGWINTFGRYVMGFGEDDDGEVYLMTSDSAIVTDRSGKIFKIVDPNRRGDPDSCRSFKKQQETTCTDDPTWTLQGRVKATDEFGKKIRCKNCTCQQLKNKGSLILKKACTKRKFKKIVREKCCFSCKQNGFL